MEVEPFGFEVDEEPEAADAESRATIIDESAELTEEHWKELVENQQYYFHLGDRIISTRPKPTIKES